MSIFLNIPIIQCHSAKKRLRFIRIAQQLRHCLLDIISKNKKAHDCRRSFKNVYITRKDAFIRTNLTESELPRLFLVSNGIQHCLAVGVVRVMWNRHHRVTIHPDYFQQLPRANQVMSAKT